MEVHVIVSYLTQCNRSTCANHKHDFSFANSMQLLAQVVLKRLTQVLRNYLFSGKEVWFTRDERYHGRHNVCCSITSIETPKTKETIIHIFCRSRYCIRCTHQWRYLENMCLIWLHCKTRHWYMAIPVEFYGFHFLMEMYDNLPCYQCGSRGERPLSNLCLWVAVYASSVVHNNGRKEILMQYRTVADWGIPLDVWSSERWE